MTQEDKDILLKYICMALPYRVMVNVEGYDTEKLIGIENETITTKATPTSYSDKGEYPIDIVKPYLRPMSSMTEEEKEEFESLWDEGFGEALDAQLNGQNDLEVKTLEITASYKSIQWLLKNHFDFMGLIPKALAIEVTKENNPNKE